MVDPPTFARTILARSTMARIFPRPRGRYFTPYLSIGDDIETGLVLRLDRQNRRVVVGFGQERLGDAPELGDGRAFSRAKKGVHRAVTTGRRGPARPARLVRSSWPAQAAAAHTPTHRGAARMPEHHTLGVHAELPRYLGVGPAPSIPPQHVLPLRAVMLEVPANTDFSL